MLECVYNIHVLGFVDRILNIVSRSVFIKHDIPLESHMHKAYFLKEHGKLFMKYLVPMFKKKNSDIDTNESKNVYILIKEEMYVKQSCIHPFITPLRGSVPDHSHSLVRYT